MTVARAGSGYCPGGLTAGRRDVGHPEDEQTISSGGTVVSSNLDAVRRVIDAFERSDWSEIDVRSGDLRIHLSTGTPAPAAPAAPAAPTVTDPDAAPAAPTVTDPDAAPAAPPERTGTHRPSVAGAHVVVSPSPGIFWRSPEPGAPPFASVGDHVEASSTLCIVEVMKLMSHVKAGVAGTVVDAFGENGVAVARGEPLFAVDPAAGDR